MTAEKARCEEWYCTKVANYFSKKYSRYYCSEACAQLDSVAVSELIALEKTEPSSTLEHPEPLVQSCDEESGTVNAGSETLQGKPSKKEKHTGKTPKNIERSPQKVPDDEDPFGETTSERRTVNENLPQIQQAQSVGLTATLEEALLDSTSICDQSIKSMYGFLQNVKSKVDAEYEGENHHIDPKMIQSACNIAAQMASLMRTKIAHHKLILKQKGKGAK